MAVVYRYTDLSDETIKYVGIVWSGNRTLKQRVAEHKANDEWCKGGYWKIEYLKKDINTRTDAEALEGHYIAKFGTDQHFNVRKNGWGESELLNIEDEEWELYSTDEELKSNLSFETAISCLRYDFLFEDSLSCFLSPVLSTEEGDEFYLWQSTLLKIPCHNAYYEIEMYEALAPILGLDPCNTTEDAVGIPVKCVRSEVSGDIDQIEVGSFRFFCKPRDGGYSANHCEWIGETSLEDFLIDNKIHLHDGVNDGERFEADTANSLRTGVLHSYIPDGVSVSVSNNSSNRCTQL